MATLDGVLASLHARLGVLGFRRTELETGLLQADDPLRACWMQKTWSTNRAVVVLACPADADAAPFARDARGRCVRAAGFTIPVLYPVGLQVVVVGGRSDTAPTEVVDRYDRQGCSVLQSVHLADLAAGTCWSGRTWGQHLTGPTQDAIERALQDHLVPRIVEGCEVEPPRWIVSAGGLHRRLWWLLPLAVLAPLARRACSS